MDLGFAGRSVVDFDFGYTVAIEFEGGFDVRVEVPFELRIGGFDGQIEPGRDEDAAVVGRLAGQQVVLATADESGWLRVEFAGGGWLLAGPDDSFEAWTFAGPRGFKVVCGPGGELSVWSSQPG